MRRAAALLPLPLLLAQPGCSPAGDPAGRGGDADQAAGAALEAAALARGIVADPAGIDLAGVWTSDTDRLCALSGEGGPNGGGAGAYRIGVAADYGEGQACLARGTMRRRAGEGGSPEVRLGPNCRFRATIDGDRLTFPAILPAGCDNLCTGRASLSTLLVERASASAAEARAMPGPDGRPLCPAGD